VRNCTQCNAELLFSARERGDGLCGHHHRSAAIVTEQSSKEQGRDIAIPPNWERRVVTRLDEANTRMTHLEVITIGTMVLVLLILLHGLGVL
jgi:hypothetical protein